MVHSDFLPSSRPAVPDLKTCESWLGSAPLADSREACRAFLALFDEIEDSPPPQSTYAAILERLRQPLLGALDAHARRFAGKAVPLGHVEAAAFQQSCDVWLALLRAWRRLLRSVTHKPQTGGIELRALCARRSLDACAGLLETCFAAHRGAQADHWRWLHDSYAAASPFDSTSDDDSKQSTDSSIGSYAGVLLLALARPETLTAREYAFVRHCASRFGAKLSIHHESDDSPAPGYAIDAERDSPPQWLPASAGGLRLDTRAVTRLIKWRLEKLAQGAEPGRLGLPAESGNAFATAMLKRLLVAWTDAPRGRQFPRRAGNTPSECAVGIDNIHRVMSEDAGESLPGDTPHSWSYSRGAAEQIHVFQRALQSATRAPQGVIEQWETLDESASGFRLRRSGPGARLALHQLIALRPHGARRFILADVRWAETQGEAALVAGVCALPGLAQPCRLRSVSTDPAQTGQWTAAFLLPVAPGLPASLVLPAGRWGPGRTLEMRCGDESRTLVITDAIERCRDYDRTRFIEI